MGKTLPQFIHPRFHDKLTLIDNAHYIANPFHISQDMAGKKDSGRLFLESQESIQHFRTAHGIKGRAGFIQEEHRRFVHQGLSNAQPLSHTARVAANASRSSACQVHQLQQLLTTRPDFL